MKGPLITRTIRQGDLVIPIASGRVTYSIDSAKNIHAVYLVWTIAGTGATEAEIKAQVGTIRVRVAGKLIMELTATELLDLFHYFNDEKGAFTVAGVLPLRFTPYMLPLNSQTQKYAIGMLNDTDKNKRNTFTVEVNMTAGPITVDACEIQLETDDEPSDTIGYHCRWVNHGRAWAAASRETVDDIPHESNNLSVLGYHVHHAAGTLTRVAYNVNDYDRISDQPRALLLHQLFQAGRTPVALYEHVDFSLGNDPTAFVPIKGYTNERLDLTWGVAPTTYSVLMQGLYLNL